MKNLLEHTRRPDISFHRNGTIRIAARVARILSLSPGDAINIAVHNAGIPCSRINDGICTCPMDSRHNCNYVEYLLYATSGRLIIGRHQAICYSTKKESKNFCANSVRLARTLLDSVGISLDKVSFMVGEPTVINNTIYLPIITHHPL